MQTRTTVQRALAGSAKETMEGMLIHDHLYKAALTELKQFRNEVFVAGALVETVLEQMIVVEGDPAKNMFCSQSSHHNEEFGILMWPGFIGGKEDSAALLALGSSFFSREVVIKSQGKGKKDNGKQRQLWFACVNTKGQLWLISSSSHYCHITPVSHYTVATLAASEIQDKVQDIASNIQGHSRTWTCNPKKAPDGDVFNKWMYVCFKVH